MRQKARRPGVGVSTTIRYGLAVVVVGAVGMTVGVSFAAPAPARSHIPAGLFIDKATQLQKVIDGLAEHPKNKKTDLGMERANQALTAGAPGEAFVARI